MAGLAGGALSFSPLALGLEVGSGGPPLPATPIALAVQAFLEKPDETPWQPVGLKLSPYLQSPEPASDAGKFQLPADDGLTLRHSTVLSERVLPESPVVDRPLILSQMLAEQTPNAVAPRWMSLPDAQMQLRSSREISPTMPGAAGFARPQGTAYPQFGDGPDLSRTTSRGAISPGGAGAGVALVPLTTEGTNDSTQSGSSIRA